MLRDEQAEHPNSGGAISGIGEVGASATVEEWVRRELGKLPPFSEEQDRELRRILGLSEVTSEG